MIYAWEWMYIQCVLFLEVVSSTLAPPSVREGPLFSRPLFFSPHPRRRKGQHGIVPGLALVSPRRFVLTILQFGFFS